MNDIKQKADEIEEENKRLFLMIFFGALFILTYIIVAGNILAEQKHDRRLEVIEYEHKFPCSKE